MAWFLLNVKPASQIDFLYFSTFWYIVFEWGLSNGEPGIFWCEQNFDYDTISLIII